MKQEYSISIWLDTRRMKSNGKYPVRLRVFTPSPRKQKLYTTKFEFTEKEFQSIWLTDKPRTEHKGTRKELKALEVKADKVAEKLIPFTFEAFERKLYRKPGDGIRVQYQYGLVIQELLNRNQIGTASTYDLSQKSVIDFVIKSNKKYSTLTFYDITPAWLNDYETYMTSVKGRSLTTVSMYLRVLRTLFNRAIEEKEIENDFYPFGKRKYQVPATKNVKKALTRDQLSKLFHAEWSTPEQMKARDFWFFSYACNGMNMKDIALLRYKDIENSKITFYRAKIRNTSKSKLRPVTAFLNEFAQGIIDKYGNGNKEPDNLVFDIVKAGSSPQQQQLQIKNFTRFINQHIKTLCKANDLPGGISTYWARHSFATNAVRNGATMEFIQESLGHGNLITTQNYFAGFDDEEKKEFAKRIMDF
ncbi:MAG: site-specific integrase [Bacteroidales bacterium]|nr:site-specific integrase [Bacteroidales bacterium]